MEFQKIKKADVVSSAFFFKFNALVALTTFAAAVATLTAAITTAPARRTFLTGTSNIHRDRTTLEILVVKLVNGLLSILRRGEFHKRKAPGFASDLVHHQIDGGHCANLRKMVLKIILSRLIGEVSDE